MPRLPFRPIAAMALAAVLALAGTLATAGPATAQLDLSAPGATDYGPLPPPGTASGGVPRPELGIPPASRSGGDPEAALGDGGDAAGNPRFSITTDGPDPIPSERYGEQRYGIGSTARPGTAALWSPAGRRSIRCESAGRRLLGRNDCDDGPSVEFRFGNQ